MKYLTNFIGWSLFTLSTSLNGEVYLKQDYKPQKSEQIIWEANSISVVQNLKSKTSFKNLYLVALPVPIWVSEEKIASWNSFNEKVLKKHGEIIDIIPNQYAIMRIQSPALLSGRQHQMGAYCGAVIKLYPKNAIIKKTEFSEPIIPLSQELDELRTLKDEIEETNIKNYVELFVAQKSRYHKHESGIEFPMKLAELYKDLAKDRPDIEISLEDHANETRQKSVIVRIPGETKPNEIIIFGSHIDSISRFLLFISEEAPGADDNASGTATNLELFRLIVSKGLQFDRTIEFHGYAAEEVGLVGSQLIANRYKSQNKNVLAMIQLDMNLYKPEGKDTIWFVRNGTNNELTDFLNLVAKKYLNIPTKFGNLTAGSSDHAAWHKVGYPVAFPTENVSRFNRKIHTNNDTIEFAPHFSQARAFAQLNLMFLGHFAGIK